MGRMNNGKTVTMADSSNRMNNRRAKMSDAREATSYELLAGVDVSAHVEKKGNLSYLSWAWAVDTLLRHDVEANWAYGQPVSFPDGTMLVFCEVTAFGKARTMQLPVMDFRNKAIANPDAFAINTAMMRCLVKAIALHGLGLYIYAGEDLPLAEGEPEKPKPTSKTVAAGVWDALPQDEKKVLQLHANEVLALMGTDVGRAYTMLEDFCADDVDKKVAIWSRFPPNIRAAIKAHGVELAKAAAIAKMNEEQALGV